MGARRYPGPTLGTLRREAPSAHSIGGEFPKQLPKCLNVLRIIVGDIFALRHISHMSGGKHAPNFTRLGKKCIVEGEKEQEQRKHQKKERKAQRK